MPLFSHKNISPNGEIGIWQVTEEESYFLDVLDLSPLEKVQLQKMKGRRRVEWLASRWLLHQMSGRTKRGAILKDENGKPRIVNSKWQISLSHSHSMAAVIASPKLVGIDIQKIVNKIERIAHKYMNPDEMASIKKPTRLEHLHVYWGAKECLYKAYGRRKLDFIKDIFINPFAYDVSSGQCTGYIIKDNFKDSFKLKYECVEDYILVYAIGV